MDKITQLTSKNGKLSHVMHLERKIDDNICVFHKESVLSTEKEHLNKQTEEMCLQSSKKKQARRFKTHTESWRLDDNNIVNNNVTLLHISSSLCLFCRDSTLCTASLALTHSLTLSHVCAKETSENKNKSSFCKMSHQLARSLLTISFRFFYMRNFLIKIFFNSLLSIALHR
jgi:hypothetical protein